MDFVDLPVEPYVESLPAKDKSVRWQLVRLYDSGQTLAIKYSGARGPDQSRLQLQETSTYVLVRIVTDQPASNLTVAISHLRRVRLASPLGERTLLHAAIRCC